MRSILLLLLCAHDSVGGESGLKGGSLDPSLGEVCPEVSWSGERGSVAVE